MIAKLQKEVDEEEPIKRPHYQALFLKAKQLDDFVTSNTMKFIKKLWLDTVIERKFRRLA